MIKGLVSIIVPAYNVENNIPYCLNSLISQTYENIEIICIDDGSKDNTKSVIESFAEKDSRIRLISQNNSGVSAARNNGLDNAKGEFIAFVDSDDYVAGNFIERLLELITEHSADIAKCRGRGVTSYDYVEPTPENPTVISERNTHEALSIYYDGVFYGWYADDASVIWNCLYKSEVLKNIRFDTAINKGEDDCFIQMAVGSAEKIVYIDERLYFYYNNEISLTHTKDDIKNSVVRTYLIYKNHKEFLTKKGYKDICSKSCEYACNNFCEYYVNTSDKKLKSDLKNYFNEFYSGIETKSFRLKIFKFFPSIYKIIVKIKMKKTA